MENCLSKLNDKSSTLHTPPLTSGHLKKMVIGIRKKPVMYFARDVHQNYGYEKITQSIKSSLMDLHDRFPSQSFELLDGGASVIRASVIKKQGLWVSFVEEMFEPFWDISKGQFKNGLGV